MPCFTGSELAPYQRIRLRFSGSQLSLIEHTRMVLKHNQ
jgi:hypothetical protein